MAINILGKLQSLPHAVLNVVLGVVVVVLFTLFSTKSCALNRAEQQLSVTTASLGTALSANASCTRMAAIVSETTDNALKQANASQNLVREQVAQHQQTAEAQRVVAASLRDRLETLNEADTTNCDGTTVDAGSTGVLDEISARYQANDG